MMAFGDALNECSLDMGFTWVENVCRSNVYYQVWQKDIKNHWCVFCGHQTCVLQSLYRLSVGWGLQLALRPSTMLKHLWVQLNLSVPKQGDSFKLSTRVVLGTCCPCKLSPGEVAGKVKNGTDQNCVREHFSCQSDVVFLLIALPSLW